MLTGGFDVLGLFAFVSPDEWKSAQAKLRQVRFPLNFIFVDICDIHLIFVEVVSFSTLKKFDDRKGIWPMRKPVSSKVNFRNRWRKNTRDLTYKKNLRTNLV